MCFLLFGMINAPAYAFRQQDKINIPDKVQRIGSYKPGAVACPEQ